MAGVRNDVNGRATVLANIGPISTATLGVQGTAIDTRSYPHAARFLAVFNLGALTEGTLTPAVFDCDTSGGTYAQVADVYGTLTAVTSATGAIVQTQAFQPSAARPFIKLSLVETVSVTTAVPVSCEVIVLPSAIV